MQSKQDKNIAKDIIGKIQGKGFEAYFAGGYVRDMLIGLEAKDIDIVTSAKPDEIEALFEKTYPIGKDFGVIDVVVENTNFEVATFRKESDYSDNRRPQKIFFTDAKNDALRRDFTINGLFYDPIKNKIIDYIGGVEDIKKRTVKFIGDPAERIEEDHLRLIRAIRFKSTLNFQYDQQSFEAIRKYSALIEKVSKERVRDELNKIITCPNRHTALIELSESKLLKYIMPEVEEMKGVPQPEEYHKEGDVFTHTYLALKSLPKESDLRLCWAVLLHDIGKPPTLIKKDGRIIFHDHAQKSAEISNEILKRLRFSKTDINAIVFLVENHMKIAQLNKMRPGKRKRILTHPLMEDLIKLAEADEHGKIPTELDFIEKIKKDAKKANLEKEREDKEGKEKIFSGDTLIEMGFEPGPKIKEIIENIEDLIAEGELKNNKEVRDYIKTKYAKNN